MLGLGDRLACSVSKIPNHKNHGYAAKTVGFKRRLALSVPLVASPELDATAGIPSLKNCKSKVADSYQTGIIRALERERTARGLFRSLRRSSNGPIARPFC